MAPRGGAWLGSDGGPSASGHGAQDEEDDATDENGRQDESARDIASSDMHRSCLPSDQPNGHSAPYSTDMTTVPDIGVKRTSAAQPSLVPVASTTTVPSSSGDPRSTVQPWARSAVAIAWLAVAASPFTAKDPLVAPAPISAGCCPGSLGNEDGSASQMAPNSVPVVVGRVAVAAGLPCPGTGVRIGAVDRPAPAEGLGVAGAVEPQALATRAKAIAKIRIRWEAAQRRRAVTGSS